MGFWGGEKVSGGDQGHKGAREMKMTALSMRKESTLTKAETRGGHQGVTEEELGLPGDLHSQAQ